ncbi:MAG: LamG domain-containing protein [Armatimonadota bacterium]
MSKIHWFGWLCAMAWVLCSGLVQPVHGSLLANWTFDEGPGAMSAIDWSGNGHAGVIYGSQSRECRDGYSLYFPTGNRFEEPSYVVVGSANINIGSSFTLATWARIDSVRPNYQIIISKNSVAAGLYQVYISPAGELSFYAPEIGDFNSGVAVDDSNWHHLAVTYDGSRMVFYVDGAVRNTFDRTGSISSSVADLYFGQIRGELDDVRIYSNVLTANELAGLAHVSVPIGHWKLDTGKGSLAFDSSGYNGPGSLYNAPTWVPFRDGYALSFDGVNDWIKVRSGQCNIGSAFTLATWARCLPAGGSYRVLMAKGPKDAGHYELYLSPTGNLCFYAPELGNFDSGLAVSDSKWHHLSVTCDGSQLIFYVDGAAQATRSVAGSISAEVENLAIGAQTDGTMPFVGDIDDVRIYNRTLAASEVTTLSAITGAPAVNLPLNGTARDASLNNRPTTINGATFKSGSRADWDALDFNGISDYLQISNFTYNPGAAFTVAAYVRARDTAGNWRTILAKGPKDAGHFELILSADGELRFYAPDVGDFGCGLNIDFDRWHHIVVSYSGSTLKFYDDGVMVKSVAATGSIASETETFRLGAQIDGSLPFTGRLANVRLYNGLLSDSQIAALCNMRDLESDTWVATDQYDRALSLNATAGDPRDDATVAMWYSPWHERGHGGPHNIYNVLHGTESWGPQWERHYVCEPEAGYFLSADPWYVHRNMTMLSNAGVDVLVIDVTNAYTYLDIVSMTCRVMQNMRDNGERTPQLIFTTNTYSPDTVKAIYDQFYSKNLYSDLWFLWQGKPLIFGYRDAPLQDGSYLSQEIKDFFNWRECWAYIAGQHQWPLYSTYPQAYGWDTNPNTPEAISVSLAANCIDNKGQSYHNGVQPPVDQYWTTATAGQGLQFAEQWSRVLSLNPQPNFVLLTAWNGWNTQRFVYPDPANPALTFMGQSLHDGDTYFVDEASEEFSQDIEPMKGGHTDAIYYQMIDGVRRYAGSRPLETPSASKTISVDGVFTDWLDVTPKFKDAIGDTIRRDFDGFGDTGLHYTNTTGRNDLATLKVARDSAYVYFYAECKSSISPSAARWMTLLLNTDQNHATGWEGYDYIVTSPVSAMSGRLFRFNNNVWSLTLVRSDISYRVLGNKMELRIPRAGIGQGYGTGRVAFDFHWADNYQQDGNIIEFAVNGDSAPDRRFDYRYDTFGTDSTIITVSDSAEAKNLPDGTLVSLSGVVTAGNECFPNFIYVEDGSRSSGIRAVQIGSPLNKIYTGSKVEVTGSMTTVNGERCIFEADVRILP